MSNDRTNADLLKQIKVCAEQMRDHSDKLYELVPKANPKEASFHPDNKDKNRAGWHGHEINKNKYLIDSYISTLNERLTSE